ncbi:18218_t:CDS:2, partial [Gigaspora margarita]
MEQLAECQMQREEEAANKQYNYKEDGEEDTQTEKQHMEEGWRTFQIFAAQI